MRVRLKSFTTYGFKSFAEKTELVFDKGITAVVGPNGSGKSNISDALRWVLGEQSAKYLRGAKMEDVIFSGSSKRRALGVAEVTVNFDNTDGTLPIDFAEVSLTRRLFRSGESEYAINNKVCRLKDIVDLMADTGLGKGSMSIIGQNKIDEILNSRAEERRSLFEEAAGIAKYRLRKKEAVRRLDDTAVNLTRISDICSEVDAQVAPLEQAAKKTKQYNDLSEQVKLCRLSILLQKLAQMRKTNEILTNKKLIATDAFAKHTAIYSSMQAETVLIKQNLDKLGEEYNQLQEEIKNKETALEKLHGKQNVLEERIIQSQNSQTRIREQNLKIAQQADALENKMQSLAEEFDAVDKQRVKAQFRVENLQQERDEKVQLLETAKTQNTNAQSEFFTKMQALLQLRNELRNLEQLQEQRMRRRESLKKNILDTEMLQKEVETKYNNLLANQSQVANELDSLTKNAQNYNINSSEVKKVIENIQNQQQECQNKLTQAETLVQSLEKMQESYEGFGHGTKAVIKAQTSWSKSILGVMAELLQVESKYITAIETALGDNAQNIVTKKADAAKAAIKYLKENHSGRATFLPLDTIKVRLLRDDEKLLAKLPGICGYASDLVSFDVNIESAAKFLLGRVLIAENMDTALEAARMSNFKIRVVTLDGDTVNAGGSLSGGSKGRRQKEGYLSRNNEIQQTLLFAENLRKKLLTLQENLEEQESIWQELQNKIQQNTDLMQKYRLRSSELSLHIEQVKQENKHIYSELEVLLADRKNVTDEYMRSREMLKNMQKQVLEKENQDTEAKAKIEALNKEIAKYSSVLAVLDNQLQDAKILLKTSADKSKYMSERMQELDKDTLRLRAEVSSNELEQKNLQQKISACQTEKIALQKKAKRLLEDLQSILKGKEDFASKRNKLYQEQVQLEERLGVSKKKGIELEADLQQIELELARHSSNYVNAQEQLQEEYQLSEENATELTLGKWQQFSLAELQEEERQLALAISDLGAINGAAIEEYEAVKSRSEFLHQQYADLESAKENLETVIREINSGMSKRFKNAFTEINAYFAKCYTKIFGGGTAVLSLSNPDDLLNSGIDIKVQPPGKKLQSLYLLSGGERALTVIALLFALLSYQPAPFCVLDEIDAPLDDANIQRFSNFLREYSSDTQFIVITHRKGTMEAADIMYGVTMEESGISKLLSVKINAKES